MRKQLTALAVAAAVAVAAIPHPQDTPPPVATPVAAATVIPEPKQPEAVAEAAPEPNWDLPNLDHERVDYWVEVFTTHKRDDFAVFLERMKEYDSMILEKLRSRNMPSDLLYLAMIESGFNPRRARTPPRSACGSSSPTPDAATA